MAGDHDRPIARFDGKRPLAVSDRVNAERLPAKTQLAVELRDRGSRLPGGRTPAGATHLHHLDRDRYGHHPTTWSPSAPTRTCTWCGAAGP